MNIQEAIRNFLKKHTEKRRWLKIVFSLGVVVSLITTAMMTLPARAQTGVLVCEKEEHSHTDECYEKVPAAIECAFAEKETHLHDDSCYTEESVLVCEEDHEHTDECYETRRTLTCDKEEFVLLHTHDENCYDSEGNLICPLEERKVHVHDASCYDENGELICTEREVRDHPEHTEECYETDEEGNRVLICDLPLTENHQHTEECIVPEHEVLICDREEHTHTDECYDSSKETVEAFEAEQEEITAEDDNTVVFEGTAGDVRVTVKADKDAFPEGTVMTVTPVSSEDVMDTVTDTLGDRQIVTVKAVDITFWNNDEEVEPAKPISVSMSSDPVEKANESAVIHIDNEGTADIVAEADNAEEEMTFAADSFSVYVMTYTVDFEYEINGSIYTFSMTGGDAVSFRELVKTLHLLDGTDKDVDTFMSDIRNIEFSDPELVSIVQVTNNSSLNAIKQQYELECEYPEGLTQSEIDEMNAKVFNSPDWVLVSLKPFSTPESITVTMRKGEVFTINVTDAQLETNVITADGTGFVITVTYDEEAGIPDGSKLFAEELLPGTEKYDKYLNDSIQKLGLGKAEDITFARFFDIEIRKDNEKIEPLKPVKVEIAYADAVAVDGELNIVHFAEKGTEIITDVKLSDNGKEVTWKQDSFSVTGTIVNMPRNNRDMLLVKYPDPEGGYSYYIVNNDASLTKVQYNASNNTFEAEDPMLWYFDDNYSPNRHIYFPSETTGYGFGMLSSDTYRRYLSPTVSGGTIQEINGTPTDDSQVNVTVTLKEGGMGHWLNESDGKYYDDNEVSDRRNAESITRLFAESVTDTDGRTVYRISDASQNLYFGVVTNDEGIPTHLAGRQPSSNAVNFVVGAASQVNGVGAVNHTVNHIDISVEGASNIDLPLARGTYYYRDPNGTYTGPDGFKYSTWEVTTDITLPLDASDVSITPDDMKRAHIDAVDSNHDVVHNAYVITGYSANTTASNDTAQVRIEGSFKVADLDPVEWYNANSDSVCQQRLEHPITYIISATKPVTFKFKDDTHGQLYEMTSDGPKELSVTVDIGLSASFDFFDEKNTCPGIRQFGSVEFWEKGGIQHDGVGMDFRLGGDADGKTNVVAIEIMKQVVDQDGNLIKPEEAYFQSFDVYASTETLHGTAGTDNCINVVASRTGSNVPYFKDETYPNYGMYTQLHDKEVIVGTDGIGLVFDYAIKPGMYYIEETIADSDDVPVQIIDQDGKYWQYVDTYIETEYVWRYDGMSGRHVSETYSDRATAYRSIPEVVGSYTGMHTAGHPDDPDADYTSETWYGIDTGEAEPSDHPYFNGFLEFYVYNVYKYDTELNVEKTWASGEPEDETEVTVELYYATNEGGSFPSSYDSYRKVDGDPLFTDVTAELVLKADTDPSKNWKGTFTGLPQKVKGTDNNYYDVDYYAKEVKIEKIESDSSRTDITDRYISEIRKAAETGTNGKVTITNTPKPDLEILKVDAEDMRTPLKGAKFTLNEIEADNATITVVPDTEIVSDATGDDGKVKFEKLSSGYYRIEETQLPEGGYVKLDDAVFYIKVDGQTISMLQKEDGKKPEEWTAVTTLADGKILFTQNTVTIGNPPGAELPMTGGIGTYTYQILGSLLIMLGVILLRIRRKKGGGEYA